MPKPLPTTIENKLDEIIEHLRKLDARDRLRTWGGLLKTLITIIPIILLLWSTWYFITHGQELMKMLSDQAASSAAQYTKTQSESLYDQLMKQYSVPQK